MCQTNYQFLELDFVGIFRAFENIRDIRDICDMLYGGTCFCILLIYSVYRAKYNKYKYRIFRISHSWSKIITNF